MLKNNNAFRDFLFALVLIILIRSVYQQRAITLVPQETILIQEPSIKNIDNLLEDIDYDLKQLTLQIQLQNNQSIQQKAAHLQHEYKLIKRQYYHKINQEDALTYLLGPIYSASKVSKEYLIKKRLQNLNRELSSLLKPTHNQLENNFSNKHAVRV